MFNPVSAECLNEEISAFKLRHNTSEVVTNFFNTKLVSEQILLFSNNDALFFIEWNENSELNRYYFLASLDGLYNIDLILPNSNKIVSDYIFHSHASGAIIEHYRKIGFARYATLRKMSLINKEMVYQIKDQVEVCDKSDFLYLRAIFDLKFDPVSERYPSNDELLLAIEAGSIFKYVSEYEIHGFYWADTKKFLTELRYLFVSEGSRGRGIGQSLFEYHLTITKDLKKNQLWVLEDNLAAVGLYKKYGFQFENLQDVIFLKG